MQYSVPQFVDVEDSIFGPLTLKQFLILLAGGLLIVGIWRVFGVSFFLFIFGLPILVLSLALAFGKFNGRPLFANFLPLLQFYFKPRFRVFFRTGEDFPIIEQTKDSDKTLQDKKTGQVSEEEPRRSRLKKLAYLLDEKSAEEDRLIQSGEKKKQWLNQI